MLRVRNGAGQRKAARRGLPCCVWASSLLVPLPLCSRSFHRAPGVVLMRGAGRTCGERRLSGPGVGPLLQDLRRRPPGLLHDGCSGGPSAMLPNRWMPPPPASGLVPEDRPHQAGCRSSLWAIGMATGFHHVDISVALLLLFPQKCSFPHASALSLLKSRSASDEHCCTFAYHSALLGLCCQCYQVGMNLASA